MLPRRDGLLFSGVIGVVGLVGAGMHIAIGHLWYATSFGLLGVMGVVFFVREWRRVGRQ